MEWTQEQLGRVVAEVMRALGAADVGFHKEKDSSGVLLVKSETVRCEPFEGRENVRVKDVTTLSEAPRIAAGVLEVERTSFPWTLGYDEFDVVLSGTLEIQTQGRTYTGRAGDIFYIPKGSSISFSSPDLARYVYVTYPADWNG